MRQSNAQTVNTTQHDAEVNSFQEHRTQAYERAYDLGTFLVVKAKKKHLLEVTSTEPLRGEVTGIDHLQMPTPDGKIPYETLPLECVLADVGTNPAFGSVFGVRTETYWKSINHPQWGDVHFWRRLEKDERIVLKEALSEAHALLHRHGLVPKDFWVEFQIRNNSSSKQGTWKAGKAADDVVEPDTIVLCPKGFPDKEELLSLIMHELGHMVWHHFLKKVRIAQWIDFYTQLTKLEHVDVQPIVNAIQSNRPQGLLDFYLLFEEEQIPAIKQCVKRILELWKLKEHHLDKMLAAGSDVTHLFVGKEIEVCGKQDMLTEYSQTSPEEMWAEAFSLWITGHKLPELWIQKIEYTLS